MATHRRRAPSLDDAKQRRSSAVECPAHRQLGSLVGAFHGELASVTEPEPHDTPEVTSAARAVHVLDPELHPSDVFLESSEREEQLPLTQLPEAGTEGEMSDAELELHVSKTGTRGPTSRGKTAGFARSARCERRRVDLRWVRAT